MTQEELLLDNIKYYSENTDRRCYKDFCYYSPKNAGKEGVSEGCGIGRHLSKEAQDLFDSYVEDTSIDSILLENPQRLSMLPVWMQSMPVAFLADIQNLHDTCSYWSINSLSEEGKERVKFLVTRYQFNPEIFKDYMT